MCDGGWRDDFVHPNQFGCRISKNVRICNIRILLNPFFVLFLILIARLYELHGVTIFFASELIYKK